MFKTINLDQTSYTTKQIKTGIQSYHYSASYN